MALKCSNPVIRFLAAALLLSGAALILRPSKTHAGPPARKAVLVELFTSEGCSSCPPADDLLGRLRQENGNTGFEVIPLGLHVDYWNSLGWKDRFSSAQFSRRQEEYARTLGGDGPYTPQMIVDGGAEFVGSSKERARAAIAEAAARPQKANIELAETAASELTLKIDSPANGAAVMLAITEDNLATKVGAGENTGRELRHSAVVRELRQIGTIQKGRFTGTLPLALEKDWKRVDLRAVVFVQQAGAGEVLGAASVPLHAEQR